MSPIGNNIAIIRNSRNFRRAEYLDNGNIIVDMTDGRKLTIFHVPVMEWLSFYITSTEAELNELTRRHGFRFE